MEAEVRDWVLATYSYQQLFHHSYEANEATDNENMDLFQIYLWQCVFDLFIHFHFISMRSLE